LQDTGFGIASLLCYSSNYCHKMFLVQAQDLHYINFTYWRCLPSKLSQLLVFAPGKGHDINLFTIMLLWGPWAFIVQLFMNVINYVRLKVSRFGTVCRRWWKWLTATNRQAYSAGVLITTTICFIVQAQSLYYINITTKNAI
jgi:hypothetical protein